MEQFIEGTNTGDNRPTIHFILPEGGHAIIRDKDGVRREGHVKNKNVFMPIEHPSQTKWNNIVKAVESKGMKYVTHYNWPSKDAFSTDPTVSRELKMYRMFEQELARLPKYEDDNAAKRESKADSSPRPNKVDGRPRKKAGQIAEHASN